MAVTLKRKRGAVLSYREPSSDEDVSGESEVETSSRPKRKGPSRRSARHRAARSASDSTGQGQQHEPGARIHTDHRHRGLRARGRSKISYRDATSSEGSDGDFEADEPNEVLQKPRAKPRANRQKTARSTGRASRRALGAPLPAKSTSRHQPPTQAPSDGRIPAWASLPYHVLLQVFVYASHPLHDENMVATSFVDEEDRQTLYTSWLVQVGQLCSAFSKPALTALYRNPPIFSLKHKRKHLVQHLTSPPPDSHLDYQVMVKRLELDATKMTSLTDTAHSAADLASLISSLTTLKEIDIFDPVDRPPYRERLKRTRRWHYPEELFTTLRESDLLLQSWRWNSVYCDRDPLWMRDIHEYKAFQSLRELHLTKFNVGNAQKPADGQPNAEELVATAIAALPNLRSLTFETSYVVNGRLLPLLPNNLVQLSITNCGELTSDALQPFLATHGSRLEELVLNHNQCLNLSFLVNLKSSCPRLEVLRMDTTYYSSLTMSADNEPLYDYLLEESEIPSWPSTLRIINMEYLRNWDATAAANFFSSLIDSAAELPWLRELRILAMIDADWRKRAEFRKKWSAMFKAVFARRWEAASPHLMSLRAFREWKASKHDDGDKNDSLVSGHEGAAKAISESDGEMPAASPPKSKPNERWNPKRLRCRARAAAHYDESSENESGSAGVPETETINHVQGLCHTVVFRIDNLRPSEQILDEADFLDTERSGDEDWDGNDDMDDGSYAW